MNERISYSKDYHDSTDRVDPECPFLLLPYLPVTLTRSVHQHRTMGKEKGGSKWV